MAALPSAATAPMAASSRTPRSFSTRPSTRQAAASPYSAPSRAPRSDPSASSPTPMSSSPPSGSSSGRGRIPGSAIPAIRPCRWTRRCCHSRGRRTHLSAGAQTWPPHSPISAPRLALMGSPRQRSARDLGLLLSDDNGGERGGIHVDGGDTLHVGGGHARDAGFEAVRPVEAELILLDGDEQPGDLARGVRAERVTADEIGLGHIE